jgi:hypothetical protein
MDGRRRWMLSYDKSSPGHRPGELKISQVQKMYNIFFL